VHCPKISNALMYRQSAHRWSHPPGGRLPLLSARPAVTFPALEHHPGPSYTAWWQRHIGVDNLPKVVTQLLPRVGFEPTTCWLQIQCSTRGATYRQWVQYSMLLVVELFAVFSVCQVFCYTDRVSCVAGSSVEQRDRTSSQTWNTRRRTLSRT